MTEMKIRSCECGFLDGHPIIWCPSCGRELLDKIMDKQSYYHLRSEFIKKNKWAPEESRFDPETREVLIPYSEQMRNKRLNP